MKEELLQLGFSNHEADVYLALVEIGTTGTGEIIRRTGLHRNIVYETLDKLISRKLVFKIANEKVTQFKLADPERILVEQKTRLEIAERIIPELVNKADVKQEILVYEGAEGFKTSSLDYIERMKPDSVLYVLGASGNLWFNLMGDAHKKYERTRIKKRIVMKEILYQEIPMERDIELAKKKDALYDIRILPMSFDTPANTLILEDIVVIQILSEPYSHIWIKNPALAKAYLNYFNAMWQQAKEIV